MYTFFHHLHVACVIASISGFALRGTLKMDGSPLLQRRLARVLPHAVDALLLLSAVVLVVMSEQYPFVSPWVTAKIVALLGYIGLGIAFMRHPPSPVREKLLFLLALATAVYIMLVAVSKQPIPTLSPYLWTL